MKTLCGHAIIATPSIDVGVHYEHHSFDKSKLFFMVIRVIDRNLVDVIMCVPLEMRINSNDCN